MLGREEVFHASFSPEYLQLDGRVILKIAWDSWRTVRAASPHSHA
jgi:hypothetical protein